MEDFIIKLVTANANITIGVILVIFGAWVLKRLDNESKANEKRECDERIAAEAREKRLQEVIDRQQVSQNDLVSQMGRITDSQQRILEIVDRQSTTLIEYGKQITALQATIAQWNNTMSRWVEVRLSSRENGDVR